MRRRHPWFLLSLGGGAAVLGLLAVVGALVLAWQHAREPRDLWRLVLTTALLVLVLLAVVVVQIRRRRRRMRSIR